MKGSRRSIRRLKKQLKREMQDRKCIVTHSRITNQACYLYRWDELEVEPGAYKQFMWLVMVDMLRKPPHTYRRQWRWS